MILVLLLVACAKTNLELCVEGWAVLCECHPAPEDGFCPSEEWIEEDCGEKYDLAYCDPEDSKFNAAMCEQVHRGATERRAEEQQCFNDQVRETCDQDIATAYTDAVNACPDFPGM